MSSALLCLCHLDPDVDEGLVKVSRVANASEQGRELEGARLRYADGHRVGFRVADIRIVAYAKQRIRVVVPDSVADAESQG